MKSRNSVRFEMFNDWWFVTTFEWNLMISFDKMYQLQRVITVLPWYLNDNINKPIVGTLSIGYLGFIKLSRKKFYDFQNLIVFT